MATEELTVMLSLGPPNEAPNLRVFRAATILPDDPEAIEDFEVETLRQIDRMVEDVRAEALRQTRALARNAKSQRSAGP